MFKDLSQELKDRFSFMEFGWGNGYVLIPRGHVLHGKHYDEINSVAVVHGGLTFSRMVDGSNYKFYGLSKRHLGKWMVGFDTCHYGDNPKNCSRGNLLQQTYLLKEQLIKFEKQCHI